MLPFMKPKNSQGIVVAHMGKDQSVVPDHMEGEHEPGLMSAAEDLISAIHSKDAHAVASALKAAVEIADSDPMEGEE